VFFPYLIPPDIIVTEDQLILDLRVTFLCTAVIPLSGDREVLILVHMVLQKLPRLLNEKSGKKKDILNTLSDCLSYRKPDLLLEII
jgi:hypothetical protein